MLIVVGHGVSTRLAINPIAYSQSLEVLSSLDRHDALSGGRNDYEIGLLLDQGYCRTGAHPATFDVFGIGVLAMLKVAQACV